MHPLTRRFFPFAALTLFWILGAFVPSADVEPVESIRTSRLTSQTTPAAGAVENRPDIQWFKEQLGISPKYTEHQEGMLGMSWTHFLTMVFLILFFFGGIVAIYLRNRRTSQILASLLSEDKDGSKS